MTARTQSYRNIKEAQTGLKKNPTFAEQILWEYVRGKSLGYKIRRQHIIECFIVDFVCLEKMLIIEVDGEVHDIQRERDKERTEILESLDYTVVRFKNEEVTNTIDEVLEKIKNILDNNNSNELE